MNCPRCGQEMKEVGALCGDEDPQCDCDQSYFCRECGGFYTDWCPAHGNGLQLSLVGKEI